MLVCSDNESELKLIVVVGFYIEMHDSLKKMNMPDYFWMGWLASIDWKEKSQSLKSWNESIKNLEKKGIYWINQADNMYMMNQSKFHFDPQQHVSFEKDLNRKRVQIEFKILKECKIYEKYEDGEVHYMNARQKIKETFAPFIEEWMQLWGFDCIEGTGLVDVMGETYWSNIRHPEYENKEKTYQDKKILWEVLNKNTDEEGKKSKRL